MSQLMERLESLLPNRKLDIFGKDSLLHSTAPYYLLTILPAAGLIADNPNPFLFIAIIYAVFPLLDEIFSLDERNPSNEERAALEKRDPEFRFTLYLAMIVSWAIFLKSMYILTKIELNSSTLVDFVGMAFIISNLNTAQFAMAHQLMHKPGAFYRALGTLHMLKLYYMHFTYHHLYRHHIEVATPSDPSSAKKGENVFTFIKNCIIRSWIGVYQDEKKLGKKIYKNTAILSIFGTLAFMSLVYLIFGLQPMIFHNITVIGSIIYLEAINYVDHYGLSRKLLKNGEYEKATILHSWNAPHRFTNYLFFKIQRHSDHHENSSKPFQTLVSMQESPFLPHGYTLMIIMSFFPKIWFKIMDPLVDAYSSLSLSDKGKINPEVREKSIKETRKFLIEICLACIFLLIVSFCSNQLKQ